MVRSNSRAAAIAVLLPVLAPAARLTPHATAAFEAYVRGVEARLEIQHARSGTCVTEPDATDDKVRIEPVHGGTWQVNGGLLHHWRAAALVPGIGAADMLALLRDYNHLSRYYAPDVVSSRAISDNGARATVEMRFRKQRVITVVLDAEFASESGFAGPTCGYGVSRSMHIWQVDQPGTTHEHRRPEGSDDGFLWRLNSYWSFEQTSAGLLVECEAVSLTRDVPAGLGWLITPIVSILPRASLEFTFAATKNALLAKAMRRHEHDGTN